MTDISVIKMIISVAVWRIYPSWVNDKLRAWEGLGHSGMFWARLLKDDFRLKLEIISFLSRVMSVSKTFFVSRAFERFGAKLSSLGPFGFDDVLEVYLKTPLRHWAFFSSNSNYDQEYFLKISFLFSKAEPVLLAWQLGDPLAEHFGDRTSKTRMKTWLPGVGEIERRRTIDRRRDWYELCQLVNGDPRAKREKNTRKSACDFAKAQPFIIYKPSNFEEPAFETRCRYRFAPRCFRGRGCSAAGRSGGGKRRKAVIRDISGVDHWGVTNLSAPIWLTGQGHCTVFRHVMQLSLLVLCWKSTLTVILPQIKKKRSLSNVGHRGTKAENLAWHSTG